jgi:hypothetical protein
MVARRVREVDVRQVAPSRRTDKSFRASWTMSLPAVKKWILPSRWVRPDVDSDSPNLPIAAEDMPTRLNIQIVAGDLAPAAVRVGNVNSIIVGTNIYNGYLAERVCQ